MAVEQITEKKGIKNEKIGEVISTKMSKTIIVEVTRRVPHPMYKREDCGADVYATLDREQFGMDAGKAYGFSMAVDCASRWKPSP